MMQLLCETKFKMILLQKGLSYGIVSKMTGIAKSTISNYANGYRKPDFKTACQLINLLDIDKDKMEELFDPVYCQ